MEWQNYNSIHEAGYLKSRNWNGCSTRGYNLPTNTVAEAIASWHNKRIFEYKSQQLAVISVHWHHCIKPWNRNTWIFWRTEIPITNQIRTRNTHLTYSSSFASSFVDSSWGTASPRFLLMKSIISSFVLSPSYCDKFPEEDLKYRVGYPLTSKSLLVISFAVASYQQAVNDDTL